jgi:ABC-type methionine transport system permease subunit
MICNSSFSARLQVLLLWWRVQYFARAFQNTRNTFLNTLVAVTRSVWPFLILLLLTLWGFAGALVQAANPSIDILPPTGLTDIKCKAGMPALSATEATH